MRGSILIVFLVGILLLTGFGAFFFFKTPPTVQAKQLFTLYFDIDKARTDSAKLFAELLEVSKEPQRAQGNNEVGSLPKLPNASETKEEMKRIRADVGESLRKVNKEEFSDPEVKRAHDDLTSFYEKLALLEDAAIIKLDRIQTNEEFSRFITDIFENKEYYPSVTAADKQVLASLTDLASRYSIDFKPIPFSEAFSAKLTEIGTPILSKEKGELIYKFTVKGQLSNYMMVNVSGEAPFEEDDSFIFTNPIGKVIELPFYDYETAPVFGSISLATDAGPGARLFKFFPDDPDVQPLLGDWELKIKVRGGQKLVIGFTNI